MSWIYGTLAALSLWLWEDIEAARFWFLLTVISWRAEDIIRAINKGDR